LKKGLIQGLKFLAFLALGLLLLWLAFKNINFEKLKQSLLEANYWWLAASALFAFFAYLSRARRWIILIHPLGYKPTLKNTFYSMMTGYLANIALPRIGEVSKCVALGRKEKIPVDQLIGTVVIERTIDILSLLVIMIFMIIVDGKIVGPFLKDNVYLPLHQKVSAIFGAAWIFWLIIVIIGSITLVLTYIYKDSLGKIRFFRKIFDTANGIIHGLKTITRIDRKWEFIFHTIFIWVNYTLMTWVVVFSIQSTSHLDLMDVYSTLPYRELLLLFMVLPLKMEWLMLYFPMKPS
jgi:uncharacterized protein (TIRG00374 family)